MPPFKLSKAANGVPFLSRLRMNDTAWDMVALLGSAGGVAQTRVM